MKRLPTGLFLLFLFLHTVQAADFGQHWIHAGTDSLNEQIWFKNTYLSCGHNRQASIRIVSGGRFLLYVNERIVSSDVITHAEPFHEITMDVTRYLRPDSNVIAVWYAPAIFPNTNFTALPSTQSASFARQLSLTYYGTDAAGKDFAYHTGSDWQYAIANASNTSITEQQDATLQKDEWHGIGNYMPAWQNAEESICDDNQSIYDDGWVYNTYRIRHIYKYQSFDDNGNEVTYRFGKSFDGWIRLTLREMSRGDWVYVNGLTYICSGEIDEQACRRFTTATAGTAVITSNRSDIRQHINQIEAIEIQPFQHTSYLY